MNGTARYKNDEGQNERLEFLYYVRDLFRRASEAMEDGAFVEAARTLRFAREELSLYGRGLDDDKINGFVPADWEEEHMDIC